MKKSKQYFNMNFKRYFNFNRLIFLNQKILILGIPFLNINKLFKTLCISIQNNNVAMALKIAFLNSHIFSMKKKYNYDYF